MDKVPVTAKALLARVNRKLAKDGERVKKCREGRWIYDLGDYFRIDMYMNAVIQKHVDLEDLAKELGVLKAWEVLADDAASQ